MKLKIILFFAIILIGCSEGEKRNCTLSVHSGSGWGASISIVH